MALRRHALRINATDYCARSYRRRKRGAACIKYLDEWKKFGPCTSRGKAAMYRSRLCVRDGFSRRRWRMDIRASRQDWRQRASRTLAPRRSLRTPQGASALGYLHFRRARYVQLRNGCFGAWTSRMRFCGRMDSRGMPFFRHPLNANRCAAPGSGNLKRRPFVWMMLHWPAIATWKNIY